MGQAAEYRKRAEECIEIARTAQTPAQRTMLLHIRDTWLRLAEDAEENSPVIVRARKGAPRAGVL